jgi:ABC-type bacteriocin/lantibiotic exporter with double-glycine peptidase domain
VSLGLILPVMGLLSNSNNADEMRNRVPILVNLSETQFVIFVMCALSLTFGMKNLFLLFSSVIQHRFNAVVATRLSQKLLENYFAQPYQFFLTNRSSALMRNINNAAVVVTGGLRPLMYLFSDLMIGLGSFAVIIFVEPIGGLIAIAIFGSAGWIFQRFIRQRITKLGASKQRLEGSVMKDVFQGIGAIKDLKLLGREDQFLNQHHLDRREFTNVQSSYAIIQTVPRFGMESLAVFCLSALVSFFAVRGWEDAEALPVLALFAASAFRILPSVNRIISSVQTLQFSRPVIATLHKDLLLSMVERVEQNEQLKEFSELKIDRISFSYSGATRKSLSEVSLQVSRGEAVGIVGASGAGKSTLVDVMLGLFKPQEGQILINGKPLVEVRRSWQDTIGYVPQQIFIADDTIRNNVALGIPDDKVEDVRVWQVLESAQLGDVVRALPNGIYTALGEHGSKFSGGQRQRIGIARALYHDPEVLVLDEATSSLDLETEHDVMEAVKSLHGAKTLVIVSHRMSTVDYCDRVYTLGDGQVVKI